MLGVRAIKAKVLTPSCAEASSGMLVWGVGIEELTNCVHDEVIKYLVGGAGWLEWLMVSCGEPVEGRFAVDLAVRVTCDCGLCQGMGEGLELGRVGCMCARHLGLDGWWQGTDCRCWGRGWAVAGWGVTAGWVMGCVGAGVSGSGGQGGELDGLVVEGVGVGRAS